MIQEARSSVSVLIGRSHGQEEIGKDEEEGPRAQIAVCLQLLKRKAGRARVSRGCPVAEGCGSPQERLTFNQGFFFLR